VRPTHRDPRHRPAPMSMASTPGGDAGKGFAPNRAKTPSPSGPVKGQTARVLFASEEKTFVTLRDWWLLELEGLWECVVGMVSGADDGVAREEWLSELEKTALREAVIMGGAELAAAFYLCSTYPPDKRWASGPSALRVRDRATPVAVRVEDIVGFSLEEVHEGRGGKAGRFIAGAAMEAWGAALILVLRAHGVVDPSAPSVIGDRDIPDMSLATTFLGDFQLIPRMVETMGKAARALDGPEAAAISAESNLVAFGPPVVILGGFAAGSEHAMDDVLAAAGLEDFATVHCRRAWLKQPLAFVLDEAVLATGSGEEPQQGDLLSRDEDLGDLGAPFVLLSGMTSVQTLAVLSAYGDSPLSALAEGDGGKMRLEGTRAGQSLLEHGAVFATPIPNSMVTVLEDLLGDFGQSLRGHTTVPADLVSSRRDFVKVNLKGGARQRGSQGAETEVAGAGACAGAAAAAVAAADAESARPVKPLATPLPNAEHLLSEEINHILKGYEDLTVELSKEGEEA